MDIGRALSGCLDPHGTGGELQDGFPFRLAGFARHLDRQLAHHWGLAGGRQDIAWTTFRARFHFHPPGLTDPHH
jgi:hypothetical protein